MSLSSSCDTYFEDPASKIRNAKWRKLGGLFKARNAFLDDPAPSPFYQLQARYVPQPVNNSESSFLPYTTDPAPPAHDAKFLFDQILESDGQLHPQRHVGSPLQPVHGARGRSRNVSNASGGRSAQQNFSHLGLPLLDVKIPHVQMERYSVMFGNVLDKTLGNLVTNPDENADGPRVAHLQEPRAERSETTSITKDNAYLVPEPNTTYPRRATSPTPSKSPSFSLFPQLPQAPEMIVGSLPPREQSPLQRSFTAPARLSPMQENFSPDQMQAPQVDDLKADHEATASPIQSASMFIQEWDSFKRAVHSPSSTCSSIVDDVRLATMSMDTPEGIRDQFEVTNDQELKVSPLKPKHLARDTEDELVTRQHTETHVQTMTRVNVHEDTLTALERPRSITSKSNDASRSLQPSKARIDQIMRGPLPNQHPEPPSDLRNGHKKPNKPQSAVVNEQLLYTGDASPLRDGIGSATHELAILCASARDVPVKEQKAAASSQSPPYIELTPSQMQQLTRTLQQPAHGSGAIFPPGRQHPTVTQRLAQNVPDSHTRQPPQIPVSGTTQPPQFDIGHPQSRPAIANTSHRLHPTYPRPSLNASNQSFPTYKPPPPISRGPNQPPFNQSNTQTRLDARFATTLQTEKDQDNIIDYYLDDNDTKSSSQTPKSPRKLQKRLSDKAKKRLSHSSRPFPYPKSEPKSEPRSESQSSQPSKTAPWSPIPISKYSPSIVPFLNPIVSPPTTSQQSHDHARRYSSTLAEQDPLDPHLLSPAVRAAREKATELIKASSVGAFSQNHTDPPSTLYQPPRPTRAGFSFIVDGPNKAPLSEPSFYSHPDVSSPSLISPSPDPYTTSERSGNNLALQAAGKFSMSKRSPSKGASLSGLSSGTDGIESRSTNHKPPRPIRSASAGTRGTGAGTADIQGHLKPEKGEKVVERQAGLVPTIVEQERGDWQCRSVNLVIESA
ncbi:hypothetical protein EPUS_02309 [Endocarpon pusillum Z07020]|uniref:Uncharacterized protein n=1 Tax=Endocarpon pusillum (strain Z07020 / HMAS-L-300199) TaxID=1263415 RepID=U1I0N3_ENDPU|nr:uncharacterized protein EPUS_02309 [Endocarpon pusillum Z07020]ERF76770.1 hypothetical protein EPUS_02309 [Endocarpon pusillum Z07020]